MADETTQTGDQGAGAQGNAGAQQQGGADVKGGEQGQQAQQQAQSGQQGDAGKDAGDKGKEGQQQQQQAAESIDYGKVLGEVQMPEGMTLDPALAKAGGEVLAKHGISADAAKDLASFFAQQQKAGADGAAKAFADQVGAWRTAAEKGSTPEERGAAKEAALKVFGKDEVALLEHFGVTNRLGFIKALAKIAPAIRDDTFVPGNAAVNGARDARAMFPNSNMNP